MPIVLDVSVAASWHFPDESEPVADRALEMILTEGAIVPAHWWFELRNTFLVGERRGRLTAVETGFALDLIDRLPIEYHPLSRSDDIFDLARKHRLSFYDAVYLDLAKGTGAILATLDREIVVAAEKERVELVLA